MRRRPRPDKASSDGVSATSTRSRPRHSARREPVGFPHSPRRATVAPFARMTPSTRRRPTWARAAARLNLKSYADSRSDFTREVRADHLEATLVGKQARELVGLFHPPTFRRLPKRSSTPFFGVSNATTHQRRSQWVAVSATHAPAMIVADRRRTLRPRGLQLHDCRDGGFMLRRWDHTRITRPPSRGHCCPACPTYCVQAFLDELADRHRKAPARWPPATALGSSN